MKFNFDKIQLLGRALMLPIALLPVAGLLLRFGQPDLLNLKYIAQAGSSIFDNLPILFALGVATGLAKENNGTAGLASAVGYFIMTTIYTLINKNINTGVLGGILIGVIAAYFYNKFKDIKLPDFLAFFGGKRFVPIITGLTAVILGIILGHVWPLLQNVINDFGTWLLASGEIGLFFYGFLNRILLITGLHHILNNLVWFVFGDFPNQAGIMVHGDIARFMTGDPTAGRFMSGFFPVMMFGLPAVCLAMYRNAFTTNQKAVAGLLLSMALTSFLTGVTEPIEFAFVFLAPILYVIHAILTGISMALMYYLHIRLGFTFSAGATDYILFFKQAEHPLYLVPIGIIYFIIYYVLFSYFIRRMNLPTIGREPDFANKEVSISETVSAEIQYIEALGGAANLQSVDACTTRLRLIVENSNLINEIKLKKLGALGIIKPSTNSVQIVLGPKADIIAESIKNYLKLNKPLIKTKINSHLTKMKVINPKIENVDDNIREIALNMIDNLGGKDNIQGFSLQGMTRIKVIIKEPKKILIQNLANLGVKKIIDLSINNKQLYIGDRARQIYLALAEIIKLEV